MDQYTDEAIALMSSHLSTAPLNGDQAFNTGVFWGDTSYAYRNSDPLKS
jgi:hypothetical protein